MLNWYGLLGNGGGGGGAAGTIEDESGDAFVVGDIAEGESIERSGASFIGVDYQSQIDTLTSALAALDGRLDTAESSLTSLDGRLDTAETDITSLDGRLDTAESDIAALESSGAPGKVLVASEVVAGVDQQHLTVTYAFQTGRTYRIQAVNYIINPGTGQTITMKPNTTVTTNLYQQYLGGFNNSPAAGRDTTGDIYGDTANEKVYTTIEWNEVAGEQRHFVIKVVPFDDAPLIDYSQHIEIVYAQTPAQTALTSFRLAGSHSATAGIGSYLKLYDMGPA